MLRRLLRRSSKDPIQPVNNTYPSSEGFFIEVLMFTNKTWWLLIIITCGLFWWGTYEVASYCYDLIKAVTK